MRRRLRWWAHRRGWQHRHKCWLRAIERYNDRGLDISQQEAWAGCPIMGREPGD